MRSDRVWMPCSTRNAFNGAMAGPRSASSFDRVRWMNARRPNLAAKSVFANPDSCVDVSCGYRSGWAAQSKLPLSTISPAMALPCPARYFVAECTTMSAPCSIGRTRYGVAMVLSTMSGTPASCATPATPAKSRTSPRGFGIDSPKNARVSGRTAAAHSARSVGSCTNVTAMPRSRRVDANSV